VSDSKPRGLITSSAAAAPPSFAFAFDIDGVLLHVSEPLPGAASALRLLQRHRIPFILLTNGGGQHESDRVADLSAKLGVALDADAFVQSHTPFRDLVPALGGKTVLVTGSDAARSRAIAERYGFQDVVIPADLLAAQPGVWPFDPLLRSVYASSARPLRRPVWRDGGEHPVEDCLKVEAVFVFNDPRDWALDTQLIVDLLLSHRGYLGTYSRRNGRADLENRGWQADGQPELFFSNADLFWATGYHLPRFGQGAFQAAVRGVWDAVTGGGGLHPLRRRVVGKPYEETYRFAEDVLRRHRAQLLREAGGGAGRTAGGAATPAALSTVYMIGDNPESDIAGANGFRSADGTDWCSVLVRTGVWHPDRGEMKHQPRVIVDNVEEAVRWALKREGWEGDL